MFDSVLHGFSGAIQYKFTFFVHYLNFFKNCSNNQTKVTNCNWKDTASTAIKDAYRALKTLITEKFGAKPSLDSLEQKPGSANKQASLREDLLDAGAAEDSAVMTGAHALIKAVQLDDPDAAKAIGLDLAGITAEFLKVGNITSEGTAARLRDSSFTGGITLGDLKAGDGETPSDPHPR